MKNLAFNYVSRGGRCPEVILCAKAGAAQKLAMLSSLSGDLLFPFRGLVHFIIKGIKNDIELFEFCRSYSVECEGRVLQLNFPRHKALYYLNNDDKLVSLGCSFTEVQYFPQNNGHTIIRAVQKISYKGIVCSEDKWWFCDRDIIRN